MKPHFAYLLLALPLAACSLTPVLNKPVAPLAAQFPAPMALDQQASAASRDWRQIFPDPRLQQLILTALANNRDLRLAALNVQTVQAQYGIQAAAQRPALEATAGSSRQRAQTDGSNSAISTTYTLGMGITAFEIDLFGRSAALSEAAFARYLASEQGQKTVQIALLAAMADAYYGQLLAREQLQLAEQTLADWQHSLQLARILHAANQSSGLELAQAEGQVASAQADLQARMRGLEQADNALQLLLGTAMPPDLPPAPRLDALPRPLLSAGLPSELLMRRPDILQAEHNLQAANADIGAARAAFFPRLSLTAALGYGSPQLHDLFDGKRQVWSFSPQLSMPIFNAGRLRAELRLAELRKSSAVVEYERAIQTAFREVADCLAGRETYGRQISAQQQAVASAAKRLDLSNLRYRAGLDGRLELLDAQRQLYAAQQSLLDLRKSELSNTVALYKALGGGA